MAAISGDHRCRSFDCGSDRRYAVVDAARGGHIGPASVGSGADRSGRTTLIRKGLMRRGNGTTKH
jgi:hypothetical protein